MDDLPPEYGTAKSINLEIHRLYRMAEDIIKFTDPIRLRINDILGDNKYLSKVVSEGAEKARISASKTVREVREIIGYKPF